MLLRRSIEEDQSKKSNQNQLGEAIVGLINFVCKYWNLQSQATMVDTDSGVDLKQR
jgi:hypothetical protein